MCLNYLKWPSQLYVCSQIWFSFTYGIWGLKGSPEIHGYLPGSNLQDISTTS